MRHCVRISDGGGTKLEPWRWQVELAHRLPRISRLITLKARQLGCSWLAAAYALWTALFQRGALVLLVSQTESDALDLLDKAVFIFEGLPEPWKPEGWKAQSRVLKFPVACSAVVALPSTRRAGRGKTARLVIADEHAFHAYAEANFAALQPTMDAGGQFWILSTANGVGNTFARLWSKSVQNTAPVQPVEGSFRGALRWARVPEEGWLPLFLPYSARPGRDRAWWERRREAYLQEWMIHQEYPADPETAFVQTGRRCSAGKPWSCSAASPGSRCRWTDGRTSSLGGGRKSCASSNFRFRGTGTWPERTWRKASPLATGAISA